LVLQLVSVVDSRSCHSKGFLQVDEEVATVSGTHCCHELLCVVVVASDYAMNCNYAPFYVVEENGTDLVISTANYCGVLSVQWHFAVEGYVTSMTIANARNSCLFFHVLTFPVSAHVSIAAVDYVSLSQSRKTSNCRVCLPCLQLASEVSSIASVSCSSNSCSRSRYHFPAPVAASTQASANSQATPSSPL
jgi:hypothetical protein